MVVQTFRSSTQEVEAGGFLSLRSAWTSHRRRPYLQEKEVKNSLGYGSVVKHLPSTHSFWYFDPVKEQCYVTGFIIINGLVTR